MDGGKCKGNYLRLMPGLCLEDRMQGKFKMAMGDMVSIRGHVHSKIKITMSYLSGRDYIIIK